MWYAVMVLVYIGVGQLVGVAVVNLTGTQPEEPWASLIHSLLWWLLWPLGLTLVLGGAAGAVMANRIRSHRAGRGPYSPERIAELERELGLGPSNGVSNT